MVMLWSLDVSKILGLIDKLGPEEMHTHGGLMRNTSDTNYHHITQAIVSSSFPHIVERIEARQHAGIIAGEKDAIDIGGFKLRDRVQELLVKETVLSEFAQPNQFLLSLLPFTKNI